MRIADALKIIEDNTPPKGFVVCFEQRQGGYYLISDYFPSLKQATEYAKLFAAATVSTNFNVHVKNVSFDRVSAEMFNLL